MLRETYKRKIKDIRQVNPNMKVKDVAPSSNSPLSPSIELLREYKSNSISWDTYVSRFKEEMNSPVAKAEMLKVAKLAIDQDIYLVCNDNKQDCHRFILIDMIEELAKANNIPVKIVKS